MAADVVVVGAGPAGAAAACTLARMGLDVQLLERARFPRDKTCGDGVAPHAVEILREMGVTFEHFGGNARKTFGGLISGPGGGWFAAEPPRGSGGARLESWIVPRVVLDEHAARAAVTAGATLLQGVTVTGLVRERGSVAGVEVTDGIRTHRVRSAVVIGADGAHSSVAKALGLRENDPRHIGYALRAYYDGIDGLRDDMELHYFDGRLLPGYGWIFPTGEHTANVGVGLYFGELRRSRRKLRDILEDFIRGTPSVAERFRGANLVGRATGWPLPVASARRQTVFNGALLTGDAASLVDPLTGEGIYTALVSGQSAARAAAAGIRARDVSSAALKPHEREWRGTVGGYLGAGRVLKNLAKSAWLFDVVVRRARENPAQASRAIGYGIGTIDRGAALRGAARRIFFNPTFFRA
ncbi:MAG TPA: geranylgeranyl reductase family protein [Candidatus Eremiobacteraceae bacterium]|nr:geranylgeranyl reductase family protein [Candidatus Eremiobacteraceae bacterium]